jgi:hypothetical protein
MYPNPNQITLFCQVVGSPFLPIVECVVSRYDNPSGVLSRERDRIHGITSIALP